MAPNPTDPAIRAAVAELQATIRERFPSATFTVGAGHDPEGIHLTATVDIDDPDDVVDLVIDRVLALQIDEHLPVYVIPVRTPERIAAMLRARFDSDRAATWAFS